MPGRPQSPPSHKSSHNTRLRIHSSDGQRSSDRGRHQNAADIRSTHQRRSISPPLLRSRSPLPTRSRTPPLIRSRSPPLRSRSPPARRSQTPPPKRLLKESVKRHSMSSARSRSPIEQPSTSTFDARPSTSSDERYRKAVFDSYKPDAGVQSGNFSTIKLKEIVIEVQRAPVNLSPDANQLNRAIINPATVVIVRRPDEGLKPLFDRPELKVNSDESSIEYQRSVIKSSKSCEKEVKEIKKERPSTSRDVSHSHPYSSKNKDQAHTRSPVYTRSRSSPPRGEFHDSYNGRRGTSREVEKRSRESFSERRIIYDRERARDQPSTSYHHRHHDDRHYELEKRRSHRSPSSRERKKSTDSQNPSRERDYERRKQVSKRRRNHSSSQEDEGKTKQENETKPSPRRLRDEAENLPSQAVRPQYSSEFVHREAHDLLPVGPMRPIMPPPMHMDPYGPYPVPMMRGPPPMMGRIPPPRMFRPMPPPPRHMLPRPPFRMRGGFGPRFYPPPY